MKDVGEMHNEKSQFLEWFVELFFKKMLDILESLWYNNQVVRE